MEPVNSFTIQVNDMRYIVKPYHKDEEVFYEVFTTCEKLFTLKQNNGGWETIENDVIPITSSLVEDIGDALEEAEAQL